MKISLFILVFIICNISFTLLAQVNLVPNNSFEEYYSCTGNVCSITNVKNWFSPNSGTPDYISSNCNTSLWCSSFNNISGNQYPKDGNSYVGICLFDKNNSNFREFVAVKLFDTLKENKKYCISFYYSIAEISSYSIQEFQLFFLKDSTLMEVENQLTINLSCSNDTINWLFYENYFYSKGTEKYLSIGNIKHDSITDYCIIGDTLSVYNLTYIYIDYVLLYECEEDSMPPPASDSSLHYKVPNVISPNGDGLNDAFVLESRGVKEVSVIVYNRWGEEVIRHKVSGISTDIVNKTILWDATHKGQPAPQGVYYYLIELSTKNGEVIIEKGMVTVL
jgi:gliding motility-associated-like protein